MHFNGIYKMVMTRLFNTFLNRQRDRKREREIERAREREEAVPDELEAGSFNLPLVAGDVTQAFSGWLLNLTEK